MGFKAENVVIIKSKKLFYATSKETRIYKEKIRMYSMQLESSPRLVRKINKVLIGQRVSRLA